MGDLVWGDKKKKHILYPFYSSVTPSSTTTITPSTTICSDKSFNLLCSQDFFPGCGNLTPGRDI